MGLVEDAAAAKKLGMTYGQYMQKKPFIPYQKIPGKKCATCGAPLIGKRTSYCSRECREIHRARIAKGDVFV